MTSSRRAVQLVSVLLCAPLFSRLIFLLSLGMEELPDNFFDVTVDDLKLMQSDLKRQVSVCFPFLTLLTSPSSPPPPVFTPLSAKSDAPLLTEAMRKAQQARLVERYKKVRTCLKKFNTSYMERRNQISIV